MVYPANANRDNFYASSEVNVEKGDHIRLKDITVNYTLDRNLIRSLPVKQLQVYLYAANLGLIWKANKVGVDPDYRASLPEPRSISVGVRSNF